jgi:3-isopropylmalate/(R)-2-methylmalate dehydratase small subunit
LTPLVNVEAKACPLPLAGVDTDQIIPARFMKRPRSEGYGAFLLHDLRQGADAPATCLDNPVYQGAAVLVARRNFGSGSSREAAVYALADYGFRVVVAPSFGDIFASNAVKNGVLPARVSEADAEALLASEAVREGRAIRIDLAGQTITAGNLVAAFDIDPVWKTQLLNGWDDIDLTMARTDDIESFRARDALARPWAPPPG